MVQRSEHPKLVQMNGGKRSAEGGRAKVQLEHEHAGHQEAPDKHM